MQFKDMITEKKGNNPREEFKKYVSTTQTLMGDLGKLEKAFSDTMQDELLIKYRKEFETLLTAMNNFNINTQKLLKAIK